VTELDIPQERDLPAGRFTKLKEDLVAQIEHDLAMDEESAPVVTHRRWRRIGLTAAALAVVLSLTASFVLGGHDRASANTAELNDNGAIIITLREAKHPMDLQRRLNDLGVPAVVDFLESGFGCDRARSTGWVQDPPGEEMFASEQTAPGDEWQYVLHPDQLKPGETAVFVFQIDEYQGEIAANAILSLSTSPVGPCVRVPNASIVDAKNGIVGG
jgi:hypothetical protein